MKSINPTNDELIAEYPEPSPDEVAAILKASRGAFQKWRRTSFAERADPLRRAGELLRERRDDLARLMALEMGKPLAQGRAEAEKCAWGCEYFAENAEGFLAAQEVPTDATRSSVCFEPLGVILAVMPWNFPLWQAFRFAAPALMAGNVGLLKHASNVSGCALAIEEILHDAGIPTDAFRTLLVPSSRVGALIEAPEVAAVTLTGSTPAGLAVAAKAGACLKKSVLELGGSDPYLILEDADLEKAAEACATGRLINAGQSCIAAKRLLVVAPVLERFTELLVERVAAWRMGDPFDEATTVGPQARRDLRDELHRQVQSQRGEGRAPPPRRGRARRPGSLLPPQRPRGRSAGHARLRRGALRTGGGGHLGPGRGGRRFASPTRPSSGSAPRSSRRTWPGASASRARSSKRDRASSTPSSSPIRASPSEGSRSRGTVASSGSSASASS